MEKSFLVDVPVRINIWIRPECQRAQFDIIKKARPSVLFIISDGGRNEQEWTIINQHRKMFEEEIDWNCKVYKLYESENQGMYAMFSKTRDFIWEKVDRCIFLEDDDLPSVSFFKFCAEMLEKYENDTRISCICGMNIDGISENVTSDYFFSRLGSIWGIAMWKRTVDLFNLNYKDDPYVMDTVLELLNDDSYRKKQIIGYAKSDYYESHIAGTEFYINTTPYLHNQLQIIPKYNLIQNVGCQENASHSGSLKTLPKAVRRLFNMKVYDMKFPLKHPKYVIPDLKYEKRRNKLLAYNSPGIALCRKLEALYLNMWAGNFKRIFLKAKEYFHKIIINDFKER